MMMTSTLSSIRVRALLAGAGVAMLAAAFVPTAAMAQKAAKGKKETAAAQKQSAWVKLCETGNFAKRDPKTGKEEKESKKICLTHHERLDRDTGMVMVSAAVRDIEGQDKKHLMVMVPLGMNLTAGIRATIFPPDLWAKVAKNEKVDDSKLNPMKLTYTICHPAGCTAEIEATSEMIDRLKKSGGMMVLAVNAAGQIIAFPVPGDGFTATYDGAPVDSQKYSEARRQLMAQIRERQKELMEKQKAEGGKAAPTKETPKKN